MFGRHRIALDKQLLERVRRHAERAGYSSADEFITHVLEKHLAEGDDAPSEEDVKRRLKGLGYLG